MNGTLTIETAVTASLIYLPSLYNTVAHTVIQDRGCLEKYDHSVFNTSTMPMCCIGKDIASIQYVFMFMLLRHTRSRPVFYTSNEA